MRSYKDVWFDEYEKQYYEREDRGSRETDAELADRAHEAAVDRIADQIDQAKDRRKYGE